MIGRLLTAAGDYLDLLGKPLACHGAHRRLFLLLLLLPAIGLLVLGAVAVGQRLTFPLALEWLEGSQIYHAQRLLQGRPLYPVETSGFLPHPYPPVHPMLLAATGALVGLDYLTARAVSLAAWVSAAAVLLAQVRRHWPAAPTRAALVTVAAGCIAATYGMMEGWYDTARVDSVALAFVVLSAAPLTSRSLGWRHVVCSAALATVSVYTKQTNVFFALALCFVVARQDRRKGLVMAGIMGALCATALVTLEVTTHGSFVVWLLNTRHHELRAAELLHGLLLVVGWAPFLLLLPLMARRYPGRVPPQTVPWLALLIAAAPAGVLPFAKAGGTINNLIPVLFLAGPVTLILAGDWAQVSGVRTRQRIATAVLLLQAVYLSFCLFDPRHASPEARGQRLAETLNRSVATLDGGVVCPTYPFLPVHNGDTTPQAGWLAHADAMQARMPGVTAASYVEWLMRVRPHWLLLLGESEAAEADLRRAIGGRYVFERELPAPNWDGLWLNNPLPRRLYRLAAALPPKR